MVTEKMIEAAERVLNRRLADGSGLHGVSRDMLEAALSTDAEPVLYISRSGSSCSPEFYESLVDSSRKNWQPLYAHPALSAQVQDVAEYERREQVCKETAMSQWERSLKRPDLTEKDRVIGAVEAYKRQAFAFTMLSAAPAAKLEEKP